MNYLLVKNKNDIFSEDEKHSSKNVLIKNKLRNKNSDMDYEFLKLGNKKYSKKIWNNSKEVTTKRMNNLPQSNKTFFDFDSPFQGSYHEIFQTLVIQKINYK